MSKILVISVILATSLLVPIAQNRPDDRSWTKSFPLEKDELASTGRNPYFILEPGYKLVLENRRDRLVITVLNETKLVDNVETRVVEERETTNGKLIEISRNFFAISKRTNSVYYFGEDVDIYKGGKVASHKGQWLSGVGGATFGMMMPGQVQLKARHYQEIAPSVAMDRAEIVSLSEIVETPAGKFTHVLKVAESSPLEPGTLEYKYYGSGIGLIQYGSMKLVSYGQSSVTVKHGR